MGSLLDEALSFMGATCVTENDKLTNVHFALVKDDKETLKDIIMESVADVRYRLTMAIRGLIDIKDFDEHEYLVYVYATSKYDTDIEQDSYKKFPVIRIYKVILSHNCNDVIYVPQGGTKYKTDITVVYTDLFKNRVIVASGSFDDTPNLQKAVGNLIEQSDFNAGIVKDKDVRIYVTCSKEDIVITDMDTLQHLPMLYIYDVIAPDDDIWQYEEIYNAFERVEV